MAKFTKVKSLFNQIFPPLQADLSESKLAEISEYFEAGEYGLALDTVVDIFLEEERIPTDEVILLVEKLAIAMELPETEYSERLRTIHWKQRAA